MATEMVSSAVAQEAVNHVLSRIMEGCAEKSDSEEHIERMEMAHIKLEAALETSNKWNITSAPLLRWRSKLKRAAQECDHTLRRCRHRLQEEEEVKQGLKSSSFPKRVTHTAMSFVSSIFIGGDNKKIRGSTTVRRFERFADGASKFLRYVELGGTPSRYMFFVPLIHHLLAGKGTMYFFVRGGQHVSLILQPFSPPYHEMEGSLIFILEDGNAPENNFILARNFRLSEGTDIEIAVTCLQRFIPYLSSTSEIVKTKLTQVPMQDLCWVFDGNTVYRCDEQQNNIHTMCSKCFRPNPFCCQQLDHPHTQSPSSGSYMELLGNVALSVGNNSQRIIVEGERQTRRAKEFPYLKLGAHFWPHASFEDLSLAVGGSASEIINDEGGKQHAMYANISFEQIGEITTPKAIDCFSQNVAATLYQMMWKSKHGSAYIRIEKTSWRATIGKDRDEKRRKPQWDKKALVHGWTTANSEFIGSWILHMPAQL